MLLNDNIIQEEFHLNIMRRDRLNALLFYTTNLNWQLLAQERLRR
jgi:hypothetical protein